MIAKRYGAVLQRHKASQERISNARVKSGPTSSNPKHAVDFTRAALRKVDAFIEVRTAVEQAMENGATSAEALQAVREQALTAAQLGETDYLQVRDLCREWRADGSGNMSRAYRLAFERRRVELLALDLR